MSDSESSSSETTFRYKTESVRKKEKESYNPELNVARDCKYSHNFNDNEKIHKKNRCYSSNSSNKNDKIKNRHKETYLHIDYLEEPKGPVLPGNRSYFLDKNEGHCKYDKMSYSEKCVSSSSLSKFNESIIKPEYKNDNTETQNEEIDAYGPMLPPNWKQTDKIIGPRLPIELNKEQVERSNNDTKIPVYGPIFPSDLQSSSLTNSNDDLNFESDEETIGPLPPKNDKLNKVETELEERALQIKLKSFASPTKDPVREEWMLELPEIKGVSNILGPRQFRSKEGPDMNDRSSWSNTPGQSKKLESNTSVDFQNLQREKDIKKRNLEQEQIVKKHKKDKKSLLDMHQEKLLSKKKSDKSECAVRRPFDRDIDLKINSLTDVQKKSIVNKAALLDDRFSSGASKYL